MSRRLTLSLTVCLTAVVLLAGACRSGTQRNYSNDNQIEVYGRHSCPICRSFTARLQSENLAYEFYDVDEKPERAREMWDLIETSYPGQKSVGLPVVRVNGNVLIQPNFDSEFAQFLK